MREEDRKLATGKTQTTSLRYGRMAKNFLQYCEEQDEDFSGDRLLCFNTAGRIMELPSCEAYAMTLNAVSTRKGFLASYIKVYQIVKLVHPIFT